MLLPSPFFHVLVFSGLLFCSCVIRFLSCFFLYGQSMYTLSLDPLYLTLGEFQAWDWLFYPLICAPRGGVGLRMEQKSRSKFLFWPGFEPRITHLAVQHATARPSRTPFLLLHKVNS